MSQAAHWIKKHSKELFIDAVIGVFVLGLVGGGALLLWISTLDIPDLSSFEDRRIQQSTKIYDRTGKILLYDLHQDVKRTVVPYENISRHIKNASVAIEDDTFFEHAGVRPLAILRSMINNVQNGGGPFSGAGGSTITQQVIKNSILQHEKTLTRKIKEAILALRLEQELTKEEILSHYLNESPYGGTIYGVEEASLSFFGKPASDVTLAEAAYLASLPQLPTYFSPYGNHVTELDHRKDLVLNRMLTLGFISEEEYASAKDEDVEFKPQAASGIRAPHFVFYVRDYLIEKYGEDSLAERGLKVITTLDWDLQEKAEEIVKEKALYNEKTYNAENAALVASDPTNGQLLVMVGSRGYFDSEIDGNFNIALAERQPGSSFKPFVYATAFKQGYTPDTVVFDLKTQFSTNCSPDNFTSEDGCYSPDNYDHKFRGPVTFKNALAQSLNVPAVKALYLAGIPESIKMARDLGITTLTNQNQYGLTLVLGGGEVKLLEMVGAYGTFANGGVRNNLQSILRIEDSTGAVLEDFSPSSKQVLDRDITLQISDILSDNTARTPLYGPNSALYFPGRDVAAKTGTTNDKRDAWVLGYTPNLVVGAWAGNNDNRSMNEISGLIITPLWRAFMDVALAKIPPMTFSEPPRTPDTIKPILRGVWFDPLALIENNQQSSTTLDLISTVQGAHSILYFVNKNDPRGPQPTKQTDPQFPLWEYPVSLWKTNILSATAQ
ncbi:MAG: transglycosylase domain-containing protein [Candidatus Pacebacteria bacterium]|nr:transglycosylase domain-containing protein [Candidatus Paceibacterota bacterium]MCF7857309.1 transglycosylase domain-containing protein [Candidatus Paceibacterota bacterium]